MVLPKIAFCVVKWCDREPWWWPLFELSFHSAGPHVSLHVLRVKQPPLNGRKKKPSTSFLREFRKSCPKLRPKAKKDSNASEEKEVYVGLEDGESLEQFSPSNIFYKDVQDAEFVRLLKERVVEASACRDDGELWWKRLDEMLEENWETLANETSTRQKMFKLPKEVYGTPRMFCPQYFEDEWQLLRPSHWGYLDYDMVLSSKRFYPYLADAIRASEHAEVLTFPDQGSSPFLFFGGQLTIFKYYQGRGPRPVAQLTNGLNQKELEEGLGGFRANMPYSEVSCDTVLGGKKRSADETEGILAFLAKQGPENARMYFDFGAQRHYLDVHRRTYSAWIYLHKKANGGAGGPSVELEFVRNETGDDSEVEIPGWLTFAQIVQKDRMTEEYWGRKCISENQRDTLVWGNESTADEELKQKLREQFPTPVRLEAGCGFTWYGTRFLVHPVDGRGLGTSMLEAPSRRFEDRFPAFLHWHRLKEAMSHCNDKKLFRNSMNAIKQFAQDVYNERGARHPEAMILRVAMLGHCPMLMRKLSGGLDPGPRGEEERRLAAETRAMEKKASAKEEL